MRLYLKNKAGNVQYVVLTPPKAENLAEAGKLITSMWITVTKPAR